MRPARSPQAQLAAAGLSPADAVARLRDVGLWSEEGPLERVLDVVDAIKETASPRDAFRVAVDLADHDRDAFDQVLADEDWLRRVLVVAGASRPLGDLLVQHPPALWNLRDPRPVDVEAVAAEIREEMALTHDDAERGAAIARIRRSLTAAIAARDLTGLADVDEVGRDLGRLAEAILSGVIDALVAESGSSIRLAVVGMGKLGGQELNYVSDIDVIFVHDPNGVDEDEAHRTAQRICTGLIRLVSEQTATGRAYELDATLRPEGAEGVLSRTVDGFVAYWERWAKTWEFQAMLKARPVGGDRDLGARLVSAAEPYVFPERLDPTVVDEIRRMKQRVESKSVVRREGARQLKLGPGGIRDIEFAVQLLQIVHGRADRRIRATGTIPALDALARTGYVADDDAATFAHAYRFLRDVEHRVQLADERRTHTVPEDPERLEVLARSLGFRPEGDRPAREDFLMELKGTQATVRGLYAKLFFRPLLEVHAAVPIADAEIVAEEARGLDEEAAKTRLEALGFHDGRGTLRHLRALTGGVSRRARTLEAVLPAMLHALSETPDPDAGLRMFRSLVESHADASRLLATLRDQPPAADLLARLLGTSEVVGELLAGQPQGMGWVTDAEARSAPRSRAELAAAVSGLLRWQDGVEASQDALRRFKRRELVRIVVRDLAGDSSVQIVGSELTALGDVCLEAGLRVVLDDLLGQRDDDEEPARIAIIAMGKLGGRELHYVSDLDVVFIHEPNEGVDERMASAFAVSVAEQVLRTLSVVTAEGTAFEVDTELRPEGRSGPLSRSLASAEAYYERWAETWEKLALLKARPVGGDETLGRAFVEMARAYAYPQESDEQQEIAIRRMKARIEKERVPRRVDPQRHLKLGPGGLSDIEWTVQLLQRRHGASEPMLRTTSTMAGLDGLQDAGLVKGQDADWLRDGYRFLSLVRNRLYLLRQRDVDALPSSHPVLERLARSMGYGRGGRQTFDEEYLRKTRRVRRIVERVFYS